MTALKSVAARVDSLVDEATEKIDEIDEEIRTVEEEREKLKEKREEYDNFMVGGGVAILRENRKRKEAGKRPLTDYLVDSALQGGGRVQMNKKNKLLKTKRKRIEVLEAQLKTAKDSLRKRKDAERHREKRRNDRKNDLTHREKIAYDVIKQNLKEGRESNRAYGPRTQRIFAHLACKTHLSFRDMPKMMMEVTAAILPRTSAEQRKAIRPSAKAVQTWVLNEAEYEHTFTQETMGATTKYTVLCDGSKRKKRDVFQVCSCVSCHECDTHERTYMSNKSL